MMYTALGVEPDRVERPQTQDDVASVVARAAETERAVVIWGGGTAQGYGHLPRRADVLLDVSGLNRIVAHEFADLTITVEAGATLAEVQDALALHNQFLPLDPPNPSLATIGGIIATNAFGPSVLGYGTVRDWLIGITVVDAHGRIIKGGGKVVKNVTGYDVPKIHVGALGTLGVIVEATFKVAPRPEAIQAAVFTCVNPEFAARLHEETSPAMSLLRSVQAGEVLAVIYSGMAAVVQEELQRAATLAQSVGEMGLASLPQHMPPPFSESLPDSPLVVRFHGTRDKVALRHNAIANLISWQLVDTFAGAGITEARLAPADDPATALALCLRWAEKEKLALSVQYAPPALRNSEATLWWPLPPALPLMRRLKAALDPNNVLNPGRFLGEI